MIFEHFFSFYRDLEQKEIEIKGWQGRAVAEQVVAAAQGRYRGEGVEVAEEIIPPRISHVLVVDDDQDTCKKLVELVNGEGYRVSEAGGGQEALDILAAEPVDLVVTELFMTDVDGWELLDRAKEAYPQTHVVVVTGNITEQGEALLKSRQADGYLIKPVQKRPLQILCRALLVPNNLDRMAEAVVVSADSAMLQLVDETLAERGIAVRSFTDMRKAAGDIWEDPPDVVLTESRVGRESGFDLCETIRSSLQIPPLPILLLAEQPSRADVKRAVQLRVNGLLAMPFTPEELIERVFKLLRQSARRPKKK